MQTDRQTDRRNIASCDSVVRVEKVTYLFLSGIPNIIVREFHVNEHGQQQNYYTETAMTKCWTGSNEQRRAITTAYLKLPIARPVCYTGVLNIVSATSIESQSFIPCQLTYIQGHVDWPFQRRSRLRRWDSSWWQPRPRYIPVSATRRSSFLQAADAQWLSPAPSGVSSIPLHTNTTSPRQQQL